jgi:hypothetical protein
MGVLAEFVKALKQCFTQWFNKRNEREGTAWEGRFRSALVGGDSPEGTAAVLRVIAAYIDLNPVRAGIVDDPAAYAWSSWARRRAGKVSRSLATGDCWAKGGGPRGGDGGATGCLPGGMAGGTQAGCGRRGASGTPAGAGQGRRGVAAAALRGRIAAFSRATAVGEAGFIGGLARSGELGSGLSGLAACVIEVVTPTG